MDTRIQDVQRFYLENDADRKAAEVTEFETLNNIETQIADCGSDSVFADIWRL